MLASSKSPFLTNSQIVSDSREGEATRSGPGIAICSQRRIVETMMKGWDASLPDTFHQPRP